MIAGRFTHLSIDSMTCKITVDPDDLDETKRWLSKAVGQSVNITMSAQAVLTGTAVPRTLHLQLKDPFSGHVSMSRGRRTKRQNDTLRGIERMIFFAQNGREPMNGELVYIHEGILDTFSPRTENPISGNKLPMRTSDDAMSTADMSRIIQGALLWLMEQDIPTEVYEAIGEDMRQLWASWYEWRENSDEAEPLRKEDLTYGDYATTHPVCEITTDISRPSDPLVIAHIISRGANESAISKSWNWLRIKDSLHRKQHAEGWDAILPTAPERVRKKVEKARKLAAEQAENKRAAVTRNTTDELDIF